MSLVRRINFSAVLIVLICFFLPWEQISCGGARDTLSGMGLARNGHFALWLIPLLMSFVLLLGLRAWGRRVQALAIVNLIFSAIATYLMNRERLRVGDEGAVISVQLTGWFWLSFMASMIAMITAIGMLVRREGSS